MMKAKKEDKKESKNDAKSQAKALKKLQVFFDKSAQLSKRFKALVSYIERASDEDLGKFFTENCHLIFTVFYETFGAYEVNCKKGKWTAREVQDMLIVMENILIYLQDTIKKRWQIRSFGNFLEKILCRENKSSFRQIGFKQLLLFLQTLETHDDPLTELVPSAVDLVPFITSNNTILKYQTLTAPDKTLVLAPSQSANNPETHVKNSLGLFCILLEHMTNKPDCFSFWWNLFKAKFITAFYPDISKQLGILDDETGFKPLCPPLIQAEIIRELENWMKKKEIAQILWGTEENVKIMLEIYRQSCLLPITSDTTIKKAIEIYQHIFFTDKPIPEVQPKLVYYRKFFLEKIAHVFETDTPATKEGPPMHQSLAFHLIQLYRSIFLDSYDVLENETRETVMYTLLHITTTLLREGSNNKGLADAMAPVILDTILFIWIRTKTRSPELWKALQDGISGLFHSMETVVQTKAKIIQLTLVIKEIIYPVKEKKAKVVKVAPTQGEDATTPPPKKAEAISKCPDTLPPLDVIPKDPLIHGLNWTVDEIKFIWYQMLLIFNKVNEISHPAIHAEAISCMTGVINILQRAEDDLPYNELMDESRPQSLSLINIFGAWLFECCAIQISTHNKGKADAYGTLCRLICRHHLNPLPIKLLSQFYAIIHLGLVNSSNTEISWAILQNSGNIFNLALPGANILIPYFIEEIRKVLKTGDSSSNAVRMKAITILSSLICYPEHFEGVTIPVQDHSINGPKEIKMTDLKKNLQEILKDTLRIDPVSEHKVMCMWALSVFLFQELYHTASKAIVSDVIQTILSYCGHSDLMIIRAALDVLSSLSLTRERIQLIDEKNELSELIILHLCGNIQKQIKEAQINKSFTTKDTVVADHFYCVLDWLLSYQNTYVFDNEKLARNVFEAIEIGLFGTLIPHPTSDITTKENKKDKKEKKENKRASIRDLDKNPNREDSAFFEHLRQNPVHNSPAISEAAEITLMHLSNFLQNFPCKEGVDVHSSLVVELDDNLEESGATTYYVYNDAIIISVVQVPHYTGGTAARIITRDPTGKYAWDTLLTYDHPNSEPIPPPCSIYRDSNIPEDYVPPPDPELAKLPTFTRPAPQLPRYQPEFNCSMVDQLDEVLQYLSDASPDCLSVETGQRLNLPVPTLKEYVEKVTSTQKALLIQASEDQKVVDHKKATRPPKEYWMMKPPKPPVPLSPYHYCRLILHHLGYLAFEQRHLFTELENSQRFHRSLVQLDKTFGREMLKIGVIYVKEGQDEQNVILSNDTKSPLYREFVRGLGWTIEVEKHRGYLGGLDPKLTTGTHTHYYANSMIEIVFHEVTDMPTNPNDAQQIHKKRHVGNDIVHIIYSEHMRDYNPQTITSQFNDAHIIVYPLPNGLFRIQVYRKENVQLFGPLLHGMAINKKLLSLLVRQTAMNANRYVRYNTEGYNRPYPNRRRALEEIFKRFKVTKSYEDVMTEIIQPSPKALPEAAT